MFIERFIDWAHQGLLDNEDAQSYLLGRGVSAEQWGRHKLGYVVDDFHVNAAEDPQHNSDCDDAEKTSKHCDSCRYIKFSSKWEAPIDGSPKERIVGRRIQGRIVFPMTTYGSNAIGFQVRSIAEKSYETFAIQRRPEAYFFGTAAAINHIWSTKEVWLVEGACDQLIIERLVAPNVLALMTSNVNKLQMKFLIRSAKTVNLCLDTDKAGREGISAFCQFHAKDFERIRVIDYPDVRPKPKDMGKFWQDVGDVKFVRHFRDNVLPKF